MTPPQQAARLRDSTFPLFDALRGLAAIAVFVVHGAYQVAVTRADVDPGWYRFAIHLDVAVPIFFAISGFLLYRPFVAARLSGRELSVRAYAWRRFLRIVPAYWVALPIIVVWYDIDEVKSLGGALYYGGFLQLYDPDTALHGLGQAWTLCIEVTYYAFLPIWVMVVGRWATRTGASTIRAELTGVAALIAGAFAWQAGTLAFTDVANLESSSISLVRILPIQFDHLGVGMLLAVLSVAVADRRRRGAEIPWRGALRFVEERAWIVWLGAFAVWLIACYAGRSGGRSSYTFTDRQFFAEHVLYTPFVFLLLAPAVFGHERRDPVRRLLAFRPLAYIGMISYSFYLWHFAVIVQVIRWWWDGVPSSLLDWFVHLLPAFVGTLIIGSISFHLIEKPFMNLKYRRAAGGPQPRDAEPAQARAAP